MKSERENKRPYGRGTGVPDPIDVHVGKRIRMRRLFLGMNQESLARGLGLTFQQIQKYEAGANRVSASRLAEVARILGVFIPYFFADRPQEDTTKTQSEQETLARIEQSETIELLRFYYGFSNENVRKQFLSLVKTISVHYGASA